MGVDVRLVVTDETHAQRVGALQSFVSAVTSNRKAMVGTILLAVFVLLAIFGPVIGPYDWASTSFPRMAGPSLAHPLGTTSYGQDVLSWLIAGTRESLLIAVIGGLAATAISVLVGVSAAYLGGITDHVLSLITDVFLVVPALPLMIIIATYARNGGFAVLIAVVVVTGWSFGARQMRSQALSLRNREFLEAARVRGERASYIILFEIIPTMTSLIVANFLGAALYSLLAAAGVQFIGLGDVSTPSWGAMLYWSENNEALMAGGPLWELAPGICIALLSAGFALLNYAFDEIGNPALRPVRRRRGTTSPA